MLRVHPFREHYPSLYHLNLFRPLQCWSRFLWKGMRCRLKILPSTLSEGSKAVPMVGMEGVLSLRENMEKDLVAAKDQVEILTVERDFALAAPLLQKEIYEMKEKMELLEGDRLSTLDRVRHLNLSPGVDFSAITLSTRWDLKTSSVRVSPKEPEEDLIEKQP
ncbi:hypothetical protein PIB30_104577 [Stylosanthes scabra]|uniref:Uncharacterized protein n=1 Tax=Stylosanthes scabra TaxID=79078 RepID=A0ABU6T0N3_9FABA|nr:hypothetical protein [Stylosanthes scabra]